MQMWLRPYHHLQLKNRLSNELFPIHNRGLELSVAFEKGDRLKWAGALISQIIDEAERKGWNQKKIFVHCINIELFNLNWCKYIYGDLDENQESIARLFLETHTCQFGMPLQWFLNEWAKQPPPLPFHLGLFRRYQHFVTQVKKEALIRDTAKVTFRDPIMAHCIEYNPRFTNSGFIYLSSDELNVPLRLDVLGKENSEQLEII